jgi:biotin carboxyl carrier protein
MSDQPLLRLSVSGPADLTVELPGGSAPDRAPGREPQPVALAADAADAARGRRRFEVVIDGWRFEVLAEPAERAALRERAEHVAAASQATVSLPLRAQIPGRVTKVWVRAGDQVEAGQRLLAIEAMKMENEIRAPRAGTVEAVAVSEGQLVELNHELLIIG